MRKVVDAAIGTATLLTAVGCALLGGALFVTEWASSSPDPQEQAGPLLVAAFLFVGGAILEFIVGMAVLMVAVSGIGRFVGGTSAQASFSNAGAAQRDHVGP